MDLKPSSEQKFTISVNVKSRERKKHVLHREILKKILRKLLNELMRIGEDSFIYIRALAFIR